MKRNSCVGDIKANTILYSSIIQIGDNIGINAKADVLAVQRERARFAGNEGNLASFPIFSLILPQTVVREKVDMKTRNTRPCIYVDHAKITGLSVSSVFQVGTNVAIHAECRTKHIRQLLPREPSSG